MTGKQSNGRRDATPAGSEAGKQSDGRSWLPSVRALAERLADEEHGNARAVRRRLESEHGLSVPQSTVTQWTRRRPVSAPPTAGSIADRAHRLLSLEMDRLERSSAKLDLDRLAKVAATLKTLQGVGRSQGGAKQRTLEDLSAGEQSTEGEQAVASASQNGTTGLAGLV